MGVERQTLDYLDDFLPEEKLSAKEIKSNLKEAISENLWNFKRVGIYEARRKAGTRGKGAKIGVIDSGIDYNHKELKGCYKGGKNLVDIVKINEPFDITGHGTCVAGVIAGKNIGIVPDAEIYVVKVFSGHRKPMIELDDRIKLAIDICVNLYECDVVNLSVGHPFYLEKTAESCYKAYKKGVLLVASSGNTPTGAFFPASYNSVISVGATDRKDKLCPFSNVWPTVDVVAPGEDVFSAFNREEVLNYRYHSSSGTSLAAPHITGILALAISMLKKEGVMYSSTELEDALKETANKSMVDLDCVEGFIEKYEPTRTLFKDKDAVARCMVGAGLVQASKFIEDIARKRKIYKPS